MQLQRQGSDEQEGQGCEQREAVRGLHGFHAKNALERGKDKGAGDESRDEWIENDEDAPLELDFVRIHEAFDGNLHVPPYYLANMTPVRMRRELRLIGLSRPCRCRKLLLLWPCVALTLAPCAFSGIRESGLSDSSGRRAGGRRWGRPRSRPW